MNYQQIRNKQSVLSGSSAHLFSRSSFFRAAIVFLSLTLSGCFAFFETFRFESTRSPLLRAEELRSEGKFEEAIAAYHRHMEARKNNPRRPHDENPNFYYLLIGDCYLELGEPLLAKEAFLKAKEQDVEPDLIIAKLRTLSKWYELQGELDNAIQVLQEFRDLDQEVFDFDIDRLHKKMIQEEDSKR